METTRYTVKEYALLRGISETAVYKAIRRGTLGSVKLDGKTYGIPDAERDTAPEHSSTAEQTSGASSANNDAVLDILRNTVDVLTAQIAVKDQQIEQLQQQVSDLTAALTASQTLHAMTAQQQQLLLSDGTHRRSWFDRVFKRNRT